MVIPILVPNKEIPLFKSKAKELEISLSNEPYGKECTMFYCDILDGYSLIVIGMLMNIEKSYNSLKEPIEEAMTILERKIDEYKKNNPSEPGTEK